MTTEEKDLLLRDLSARLPYGVFMGNKEWNRRPYQLTCDEIQYAMMIDDWDDVPYLRSMSSMTEKERIKIQLLCDGVEFDDEGNCFHYTTIYSFAESFKNVDFDAIDWLLAHHFDFRGLIPLGLAIEVTEENNPYKVMYDGNPINNQEKKED